jgi:hypothetical protein
MNGTSDGNREGDAGGRDTDSPPSRRRVTRPDLSLAAGAGRTVSLISSLIHVRVPTSITV